jgi:putative DNA modification/repair radical SAM protein
MVSVAKSLRTEQKYWGYIHLKAIPGASSMMIDKAGLYADRLSVNMEIASEPNLKMLAPQKDYQSILHPMGFIKNGIIQSKEERRKFRSAPKFAPAGQSTQIIIGATNDSDHQILNSATTLYKEQSLKRVYYSGYLPLNKNDHRLPALVSPPLKRENRLYQADWLFRFYHFSVDEIVNVDHPHLELDVDPKLAYALRNPSLFPIDVNTASYELILRIPGIGVKSAQRIIQARRFGTLHIHHLKKMGVVLKRAQYFISSRELGMPTIHELKPDGVRRQILQSEALPRKSKKVNSIQLSLFP